MLIDFEVTNWRSYRDFRFSCEATRERKHKERVPLLPDYNKKVLPVTAIYGGNASGKTNIFLALSFVQRFVTSPINVQPQIIGVEPFALSEESRSVPTSFSITFFSVDSIYEYSFTVDRKRVSQEKLVRFDRRKEVLLFERNEDGLKTCRISDSRSESILNGTPGHVLFLTNGVFQNIEEFKPIYRWFSDTLTLIAPDTRFNDYEKFLDSSNPIGSSCGEFLQYFDTGVSDIVGEDISYDRFQFDDRIKANLESNPNAIFRFNIRSDKYVVQCVDGTLRVRKLVTVHRAEDKDIHFDMEVESDGTKRLIDLFPMMMELEDTLRQRVYVVDEIDRSLHYLAVRGLLERYLERCEPKTRSQLIFTTHDLLLMTQNLLRRDEMWITQRTGGESSLLSIVEFKFKNDKDILDLYLDGRFGGIPSIY